MLPKISKLCIISDRDRSLQDLRKSLYGYFFIEDVRLETQNPPDLTIYPLFIVDFDLGNRKKIDLFRKLCEAGGGTDIPKLFVVDGQRQRQIQAANLGATAVLSHPIDDWRLRSAVSNITNALEAMMRQSPNKALSVVQRTFAAFDSINSKVVAGGALSPDDVSGSARQICTAVESGLVIDLINTVNLHQSHTCRHSLHVTCLATAFADRLGFGEKDKNTIAIASMVHDIGKADVPLEILEKEGPLTEEERETIRFHPYIGRKYLERNNRWDPLILKLVYEHHELLNGGGYPQGLKGNEIIDPVRMLTIVDIFSALVDKRAYKDPMPPARAMEVLYSMRGKLDMDLVRAFEPIGRSAVGKMQNLDLDLVA